MPCDGFCSGYKKYVLNFNKFRHSLAIFGVNHTENSFYYENRTFSPNIITSLRSDDVIMTSLETTLSRAASRKRYNNVVSNNFRKLKCIVVIFVKQQGETNTTVQRKSSSTN